MAKILGDHKRIGRKLVPPLISNFNFTSISWSDISVPDMLWIAYLQKYLGNKDSAEFLIKVCKNIGIDQPEESVRSFALMSNYETLSEDQKQRTFDNLNKEYLLRPLQFFLSDFSTIYTDNPLAFLLPTQKSTPSKEQVADLKVLLNDLYERDSVISVFTAASVIYNQFVNGNLIVTKESSLAEFPKISDYPNTDISKRIASSIRASLKFLHMPDIYKTDSQWLRYFWTTTYKLEPCKI